MCTRLENCDIFPGSLGSWSIFGPIRVQTFTL